MKNDFGILTLATKYDFKKAIGLSLSLKNSENFYNTTVVCSEKL